MDKARVVIKLRSGKRDIHHYDLEKAKSEMDKIKQLIFDGATAIHRLHPDNDEESLIRVEAIDAVYLFVNDEDYG